MDNIRMNKPIAVVAFSLEFAIKWLTTNQPIKEIRLASRTLKRNDGIEYKVLTPFYPEDVDGYEFDSYIICPDYRDIFLDKVRSRVR